MTTPLRSMPSGTPAMMMEHNMNAPEQIAYLLNNADTKVMVTEIAFLDVIRAKYAREIESLFAGHVA